MKFAISQGHQLLVDLTLDPFSFNRLEVSQGITPNLFLLLGITPLGLVDVLKKVSRLAASVKTRASSPTTSVTSGWPMVIVLVLSNTTV